MPLETAKNAFLREKRYAFVKKGLEMSKRLPYAALNQGSVLPKHERNIEQESMSGSAAIFVLQDHISVEYLLIIASIA